MYLIREHACNVIHRFKKQIHNPFSQFFFDFCHLLVYSSSKFNILMMISTYFLCMRSKKVVRILIPLSLVVRMNL